MQLAEAGVPIFGLNYKDNPSAAKRFLTSLGDPYPPSGRIKTGKVALDIGVYGVPETFLLDGEGRVVMRHVGPLDEAVLREIFALSSTAIERAEETMFSRSIDRIYGTIFRSTKKCRMMTVSSAMFAIIAGLSIIKTLVSLPVWSPPSTEDGEEKILMCKRAIEPRKGFWTLPAGFMEKGETVAQGAAREANEEACAEVDARTR